MRYEFDSFNGGRIVVDWYDDTAAAERIDEPDVLGMAGWHPPEKWPNGVAVPGMPLGVAGARVVGKPGSKCGTFKFGEEVFQVCVPSPTRKRPELRRLSWLHHSYAKEAPPARAEG